MHGESLQIESQRQQAARLADCGEFAKSVELLRRANAKWRNDASLMSDLASAYVRLPDFKKAERCLSRLLDVHAGNAEVLKFVAELRYAMRHVHGALDAYELCASVEETTTAGWLGAAAIQERMGQLEAAAESVRKALKRDAGSERGRYLQSFLFVRMGRWGEAEQCLCDLLGSGLHDREIHWRAGHQLAAVLDRQGEHASALQVLLATKQGMEHDYAAEIKAARATFLFKSGKIRQLMEELTPRMLEGWMDGAEAGFPAAVLAGHPRSGTTLLGSIVGRHSQVSCIEETACMENQIFRSVFQKDSAEPKLFESGYLAAVTAGARQQAQRGYLNAIRQFSHEGAKSSDLIIDKNPMLTQFLAVALRFMPGLKMLMMLRDPRDVCWSCFQHPAGVAVSNVSWLSIEDTMTSYRDIMEIWLRLREMLPTGWLEVRYEELVKDTEEVSREVVDFLELPWQACTQDLQTQETTIHSPTYAEVAKPVYRSAVGRWKAYEEFLSPHMKVLESSIQSLGY
ncbi:hypothetical protein NT6N_15850 [Oceaniferula spumae]|uniref:Sulfotransferase family protein n=1 Tax=Oceaniferula spumae TaxID=2979115 RepID=A0AAT9FKP5_9BACT